MPDTGLHIDPASLPRPGNLEMAAHGLERWRDQARQCEDRDLGSFAAAFAEDSRGHALLTAVFGNSPFLGRSLLHELPTARNLVTHGADAVFRDLLGELRRTLATEGDAGRVMQALRAGRRRAALIVALADIAGAWRIEHVTAALSDLADACVGLAVAHLLRRGAESGDLRFDTLDTPAADSGLVVIGMGKLGARELNYSSDIDLIVFYDPEKVDYHGSRTLQDYFVRLTRELVRLLQERTESGFVFRTDLRLRPDPASTPLAMSVLAAETYYEGMGQNWERAAMIKARAIAGDITAGELFLRRLRPFVWRKHLDFAAIQDIHSIKRQIHATKGHHDIAVGGHNIKLGRGGIREIEFYAQTQQLIWGGRQPELRIPATCPAIRALVAAGRVAPQAADEMIAAYRFLRHVEHRLQMVDDRQTQTLPPAGPELDAIAAFAGFPSTAAFSATLLSHLGDVEDHYAELFEEAPPLGGPGNLVFTGTENDPETVATLARMGFSDGASISNVIRGWHHGRYRAMRSTRARELLTELMPRLLEALARTTHPDAAFARFDEFLGRLPAGVQLFSLLYANPGLLDLLAEIMGGAPRLAEHLSRNASLLDAVLVQGFFDPLPATGDLAEALDESLRQANDFQDVLDIVRRWTKDHQFQVGVRVLRHITDADAAGSSLADIADTAIAALQPHVERDFARLHGRLPGAGIATVGLGKLGSREMTVTSDLDLIFIYDVPAAAAADGSWDHKLSDGPKPLAPIHYYARLAQRLINATTAPTGEGRLFEVDMRLRPSGNAGPIASSLEGFGRYQVESAWTWEHMALTRARVIAGDPGLAERIRGALQAILARPRDPAKLAKDVADMRARIAQQFAGEQFWDLKYRPGGMIDVEFIAQYLQLRHAAESPGILHPTTAEALRRIADAGHLDAGTAAELIDAARLWHRLLGMLRLTVGGPVDAASLGPGLARALATAGGVADIDALERRVASTAARVRAHFVHLVAAD
jgi:[glutamine synthetase] adenylyltransferase / [glutamine synthetase]-adenylyl-L-tyrosine phosphorylase